MIKIAIYGKGGIGKSTMTSNLAAAFAYLGKKVIQIGCDPKADSTINLLGGQPLQPVMDYLREKDEEPESIDQIAKEGYGGVLCIETGGPTPGLGCAGRGIIAAIELLNNNGIIDEYDPDIIIYDVLGDVVCGGFAMPIRKGIADQVYTVTSSDYMAIYAVNNLFKGILKYSNNGGALLGGVIGNSIKSSLQEDMIKDFTERTNSDVIQFVPRSPTVTRCELDGVTTIEGAPDSKQAEVYRELARKVINNKDKYLPTPFDNDDLSDWASGWINQLLLNRKVEIDNIQDGASGI